MIRYGTTVFYMKPNVVDEVSTNLFSVRLISLSFVRN